MGLVSTQAHVLGRDQKYFVGVETTMGTFVKAATGASCNCIKTSFNPNHKRKDRTDALMASRDVLERITDKVEIAWSYDGYYIPSGTKNVAPRCGPFIVGAGFTETINANDVSYALNSAQTLTTLSQTRQMGTELQECLSGAWVEELKFMFAGGEEPKISASGGAMGYAATGRTTLNGALASAATTMVVNDGGALMCTPAAYGTDPPTVAAPAGGARSIVTIDDGSDPQDGVEITVDSAAPSFTCTAIAASGHDNGAAVYPYVPTHTDVGSPISGVGTGSTFTWDSLSIPMTAFEFSIKQNLKVLDDEALRQYVGDVIPGIREISGSITFRIRRDNLIKVLDRKAFSTIAIALTCGGAAQSGTRLVVSIPYAEAMWSEIQVPEAEEATINLPFKALGSSGNDAITIQHT